MDKTFVDVLTEEMKESMIQIRGEVRDMFRGKDPYRQVKQTDADRIAQYLATTPQQRQQYINDFGEQYINYEQKMEQKIREYGNG